MQITCNPSLPILPSSHHLLQPQIPDSFPSFTALYQFDLISSFLCNTGPSILEQIQPSSSPPSLIYQVLDLFIASSNLRFHFPTGFPPSTLKNPLSALPVEPLRLPIEDHVGSFSRSDHCETLWKGARDPLGPLLTFPTSFKCPLHFLSPINLCTIKNS